MRVYSSFHQLIPLPVVLYKSDEVPASCSSAFLSLRYSFPPRLSDYHAHCPNAHQSLEQALQADLLAAVVLVQDLGRGQLKVLLRDVDPPLA